MSLFDRMPMSRPSSLVTRRAWVVSENFLRISLIRASEVTVGKSRSTMRSMLVAVRTTRAVVAES